jgi:uncharacterized membrane protein
MIDVDENLPSVEINLIAPWFALGCSATVCSQCGSMTPVFALALLAGHRVFLAHDDDDDLNATPVELAEGAANVRWETATGNALLFDVDEIGAAAASRLGPLAPSFRRDTDVRVDGWVNHCSRCHAILDDHDLFCEPDGVFLPTSPEAAQRIQFVTIDACFQAAAGGYAYEPAFVVFPG